MEMRNTTDASRQPQTGLSPFVSPRPLISRGVAACTPSAGCRLKREHQRFRASCDDTKNSAKQLSQHSSDQYLYFMPHPAPVYSTSTTPPPPPHSAPFLKLAEQKELSGRGHRLGHRTRGWNVRHGVSLAFSQVRSRIPYILPPSCAKTLSAASVTHPLVGFTSRKHQNVCLKNSCQGVRLPTKDGQMFTRHCQSW